MLGTVDLLQTVVINNVGNGVEQLQRPNLTDNVYRITRPLTDATNDGQWPLILSTGSERLAWFAKISSDYVGNVFRWDNDILNINILESNSGTRLISIQPNDSPAMKFPLPASNGEFQTLGFTLRDGVSLSVYSDCNLVRTSNIPQRLAITNSNDIQLFANASNTSAALVSIV